MATSTKGANPPAVKSKTIKAGTKLQPADNTIDTKTIALDLGCGPKPRNPFNADQIIGIDIINGDDIKVVDLVTERIPFDDNVFDFVTAFDLLQTIPRLIYNPTRRLPFIELMSEIFRVLKPGGRFLSMTPIYPKNGAFRDPTHVNFITPETFTLYFDRANNWAKGYGFKGGFIVDTQETNGDHHLVTNLRKPDSTE